MWLTKKLAPDHKTIADFRKNNIDCIKAVFSEFVYLCRSLNLYGAQLVGIDGTKLRGVNSQRNNLQEKTVTQRLKQIEEKIVQYLTELENNDATESESQETAQAEALQEKISQLEDKKQQYQQLQDQMKASGQREVSLVDPDSRLMRVASQHFEVGYNIQASVDSKQHLIVDYDVVNISTDHHQLARTALAAKMVLGVTRLDVCSDKGFYVEKDVAECESNGITVFMPIPGSLNPHKGVSVPEPMFYSNRFVYDGARDVYVCPAGNELFFWRHSNGKGLRGKLYRSLCCGFCVLRGKCTRNRRGRVMYRGQYAEVIDRLRARLATVEGREKCRLRRLLVEHPFGTIKRAFNQGYLLLRGLRKVRGEVGFTMLAYNMRRAISVVGVSALISLIKT